MQDLNELGFHPFFQNQINEEMSPYEIGRVITLNSGLYKIITQDTPKSRTTSVLLFGEISIR